MLLLKCVAQNATPRIKEPEFVAVEINQTAENDSDEILTLENRSNYVTSVYDHAKESRPVFAGQVVRLHQCLEDPLRRHGSRWDRFVAFGGYEKSGGAAF
jgi:hypothetical protein